MKTMRRLNGAITVRIELGGAEDTDAIQEVLLEYGGSEINEID